MKKIVTSEVTINCSDTRNSLSLLLVDSLLCVKFTGNTNKHQLLVLREKRCVEVLKQYLKHPVFKKYVLDGSCFNFDTLELVLCKCASEEKIYVLFKEDLGKKYKKDFDVFSSNETGLILYKIFTAEQGFNILKTTTQI